MQKKNSKKFNIYCLGAAQNPIDHNLVARNFKGEVYTNAKSETFSCWTNKKKTQHQLLLKSHLVNCFTKKIKKIKNPIWCP